MPRYTGYGVWVSAKPDGHESAAALPEVDDSFIDEALELGAVTVEFVSGGLRGHFGDGIARQERHLPPVISVTDDAWAVYVAPFVDEYEADFGTTVLLDDSGERVLAKNQYDQPVVVAASQPKALFLPRIQNEQRRNEAAKFLMLRTIPALFPEVMADQYLPERVQELEAARGTEITRHRKCLAQIDAEIDEERKFAARYAGLGSLMDEGLKDLVKRTLEEVFNLEVIDLDERYPEAKNGDLLVEDVNLLIETRGSESRNVGLGGINNVAGHAKILVSKSVPVDHRLLVFNGQLAVPPASRNEPFHQRVREEADIQGVHLLTGRDLLDRVGRARRGTYGRQDLLDELTG